MSPLSSSNLPEDMAGHHMVFCLVLLRMGFTLPLTCYQAGGGLLHHLFTLTTCVAVILCCTSLGVASTGRYPASCPMKPGLSSPPKKEPRSSVSLIFNFYTLKQLPPTNSLTIELCGRFCESIHKKYSKNLSNLLASKYSGSSGVTL